MDKNFDHIDSSRFEFVQSDSKIYDKKFETKPVGYFKDAMIRFTKNKTNVVASIILLLIISLSVFVPIFSPKNSDVLEEQLSFLPPRIPFLEKFGIADGTILRRDQPVDMTTINPDTGLGLPVGVTEDLIVMETLTNYLKECTDADVACVGGYNQIRVDSDVDHVAVISPNFFVLDSLKEATIEINIKQILKQSASDSTVLNVYLMSAFGQPYELVYTISESGVYEISPFEIMGVTNITSKIKLEIVTDNPNNSIVIESVKSFNNTQTEPLIDDSGYNLSLYVVDASNGGAGRFDRAGGQRLLSSYRYKKYDAAFGLKQVLAFSSSDYDKIMNEFWDVCIPQNDPDNPEGLIFPEGCPIVKVIKQNEEVVVGGIAYSSYELILNYKLYKGYDEIPYYIFGTSAAGKDLFKLIWIATRTSLIIGLIVASINISIGIVYGAIAGYYGGKVDMVLERISEIVGQIPWLVTLSIAVVLLGPGIQTLIVILIINGWIGVASTTRTQFYRYKGREYVLASRTLGAKDGRLIFRHILPNAIGTIITASILMIPYVIFSEATISYLGFGIGHGTTFNFFGVTLSGVSLGVLLSDGRAKLIDNPYLTLFPAIVISILMITFNMFGNALRDAFNPALRGAE